MRINGKERKRLLSLKEAAEKLHSSEQWVYDGFMTRGGEGIRRVSELESS